MLHLRCPPHLFRARKHAAQRILHMWIAPGEKLSREISTFNRYGAQLGTKVPLWGGFSGTGKFTLRLWTKRPKMTKPEWEMQVPALKGAVDDAGCHNGGQCAQIWHDNERFLLCPDVYRKGGLEQVRFPPNSGSIQASCCSDSSLLLYSEAWRDEELLPKAGTRHDKEVAKMSFECLWALRQIRCHNR